jgi:hypothetical protein
MSSRPLVQPEQVAAWSALPTDYFSAQEKLRVLSFVTTPAALKLRENFPALLREMMTNAASHAPRMGQLTVEVYRKHTDEFVRKLGELKIAPAQGGAAGGRKRRR